MIDSPEAIKLLTEINAALHEQGFVKYFTPIIGMLGVVVGATLTGLFQYFNNRQILRSERDKINLQIKSEIITKQRQEWMDSIRESAVEFLSNCDLVMDHIANSGRPNEVDYYNAYFAATKNYHLLALKLNTRKPDQKHVIDLMVEVHSCMRIPNENEIKIFKHDYNEKQENFRIALTDLFNQTWDKIKEIK